MRQIKDETPAAYNSDDDIIAKALVILESRMGVREAVLTRSQATKDFLRLRMAELEHEVFCAVWLDSQHRVIKVEELFTGTIDGAAVYPREVVKKCLRHNAAAVIFAHNHPSGLAEPSQADVTITRRLIAAMDTIEVRVLDHIVVGGVGIVSFAERGLL